MTLSSTPDDGDGAPGYSADPRNDAGTEGGTEGGTGPADPDFFDTAYYRLLEPFHTEADARYESAALRELLGLAQGDRVLDLGCGWGRHLRLLAGAGHDVVGLDRSIPLLRRARRTQWSRVSGERPREEAATPEDPLPTPLVAGDMRRLPLADSTFDAVLNLATSLGLFLDDETAVAALAEARRVLRPRGRLLIEGMHRADVEAHFAARDAWELADGTRVRVRRRFDAGRGVSHEALRWEGPGGAGKKRHSLRVRSGEEMVGLIRDAGLDMVATYGDWDGTPFHDAAARFVAVAAAR